MPMLLYPGETADDVARFTAKTKVTAAAVVFGGEGYAVNDILRVIGGDYYPASLLKVSGVTAGVVTAVTIEASGQYLAEPANPVSTVTIIGSGRGATFNLTTVSDAIVKANIVNIEHRRSIWYLKYWE